MRDRVIKKLTEQLDPEYLEVIDESYKHAGHGNFRGAEGTHFQIVMKAEKLKGLSRVKAHQEIYKILADELNESIHALAISLL